MEDIKITYREVVFALIIFNIAMGVLFGSLPLIAGSMLQRRKLAWMGFALSVVVGSLLGIIVSYLIAVVFLWLILRQQTTAEGSAPAETDGETPDA